MKQYAVTGMACAACSARVEKAVSRVEGVSSCSVNLLTKSMGVEGDVPDSVIIQAVVDAGYGAHVMEQEKNGEQPRGRQQNGFRQNRGEKHGASKQMQQVEFECRHRQQGGKQKLPAPFQLQRQNSAAKNVNRQQCSENQNHMSLS